jgi:hypothetical protein
METRIVQAFIGPTQKLFFAYTNQDFISASQTDPMIWIRGGAVIPAHVRNAEVWGLRPGKARNRLGYVDQKGRRCAPFSTKPPKGLSTRIRPKSNGAGSGADRRARPHAEMTNKIRLEAGVTSMFFQEARRPQKRRPQKCRPQDLAVVQRPGTPRQTERSSGKVTGLRPSLLTRLRRLYLFGIFRF